MAILSSSSSTSLTHKFFLLSNYILIGAAASCGFLVLSLRLLPSAVGILLILLHLLTILISISSISTVSSSSPRSHAAHMAATVIAAILQGAVALLVFSNTAAFLRRVRSYVEEEDGVVILRMVGGLGVVVFVVEWVVLVLAFAVRFYVNVEVEEGKNGRAERLGNVRKDWQPFQVV